MERSVILENALSFDPLHTSEILLGKTGENRHDDDVSALGLVLAMENGNKKRALLMETEDSYFSITVEGMIAVLESLGLKQVLVDDIAPPSGYTPGDKYYIYAGNGMLAAFDTWGGHAKINGGNIYYNWVIPDDVTDYYTLTSSGRWHCNEKTRIAWTGGHDIREGVKYKMTRMMEVGFFLPVWVSSPRPWLVHWGETEKGSDYDAIRQSRIERLPQSVIDMMGPVPPS